MSHTVGPALILAISALAAMRIAVTVAASQAADWTAEKAAAGCMADNADGLRIAPCAGWIKTRQNRLEDFVFEFEWRSAAPDTDVVLALFGADGRDRRPAGAFGLSLFGNPLARAAVAPMRVIPVPIDAAKVAPVINEPDRWHWYSVSRNEDRLAIAVNGVQIVVTSAPTGLDGWIGLRVNRGAVEIRGTRLASRPPSTAARMLARGGYVARRGNGVVAPKLRHEERPNYTDAARAAKLEGIVVVELVVDANGQVVDPVVVRSLDDQYGLDQSAIRTVKQWWFQPGTYQGKPVPVVVTIEVPFALAR